MSTKVSARNRRYLLSAALTSRDQRERWIVFFRASAEAHPARYNLFLGLAILRLVLILHALAVLAQAVFAGEFLSGVDSPVKFHEFTGWVVLSLAAMQLAAAAALFRSNITSLWLVFGSVFVL